MSEKNIDLLITFLGRTPKDNDGYRKTIYDFDTESRDKEKTAFFGWSLQNRINAKQVLILGTETSMWDHLFERDIDLGDALESERIALMEAVEKKKAVNQEQLDKLSPQLSKTLGYPIKLRLIPFCKTDDEQSELLRIMAEEVSDNDIVHLDVTHGFRHLPMLSLLAALYLQRLKHVKVAQIWYGSYDPDTRKAPVYKLSGLLDIAHWLQVISAFDQDGDYGILAPLLGQAGFSPELIGELKKAAYFENVLNVGDATGCLRKVLSELKEPSFPISPSHKLFLPVICKRLEWVAESKQFEKQIKLAEFALKNNDYLRAILYSFESMITHLCQKERVNVDKFKARESTREKYENKLKKEKKYNNSNYKLLKDLRNQVAHGSRGTRGEVQQILLDEKKMKDTLKELLDKIKNRGLPDT